MVLMRCQRRSGHVRVPAGGAVAIALLAVGLLAGCGGGAHASSPTKVMPSALHYANCMRSHGVSNFPDPNGQGQFSIQGVQVHNGVRTRDLMPSSPAFQAAERVCGPFGSAGRQVTTAQEKQGVPADFEGRGMHARQRCPDLPRPQVHRRIHP